MQHAIDAGFDLIQADVLSGNGIDTDGAAIEAEPRIPATRTRGELLLDDKPLIKPAGAAVTDDFHQQIEGLGFTRLSLGQARRQVEAPHGRITGAGILEL